MGLYFIGLVFDGFGIRLVLYFIGFVFDGFCIFPCLAAVIEQNKALV